LFVLEPDDVVLGKTTEVAGDVGVGTKVVVIDEELLQLRYLSAGSCITHPAGEISRELWAKAGSGSARVLGSGEERKSRNQNEAGEKCSAHT
jgi:hypothetical protein